jgi:hypothetical protein
VALRTAAQTLRQRGGQGTVLTKPQQAFCSLHGSVCLAAVLGAALFGFRAGAVRGAGSVSEGRAS